MPVPRVPCRVVTLPLNPAVRILRRLAFTALAVFAVFAMVGIASTTSPREGIPEEVVHESNAQLGFLPTASGDGFDDLDFALPTWVEPTVAPELAHTPFVSASSQAPRAPQRARATTRGPPARA